MCQVFLRGPLPSISSKAGKGHVTGLDTEYIQLAQPPLRLCLFQTLPDAHGKSRGYIKHVSEEKRSGRWVEECVYKAEAFVNKGHAQSPEPELIFAFVCTLWIQSPCTEKDHRGQATPCTLLLCPAKL